MFNMMNFKGTYQGISSAEAESRLRMYGYNTDTKLEADGKGFRPIGVFFSLRFLLMFVNAILLILNSELPAGITLLFLSAVYGFIEIVKGTHCDEKLHNLKRSSSVKFRVVRNGEIILLRREYLVPDDVIILQGGESVPADAHLLEIHDVTADESIFTGDRSPVFKTSGSDSKNEIKHTCIYKETRILSGSLIARVTATGEDTRRHKTLDGKEHKKSNCTDSSIENFINKVNPVFVIMSLTLTIAVWLFNFMLSESGLDDIFGTMISAIAFGLCFIPAETASIVRLYYVWGALKLAGKNSLVKDISVIENLGALTAVCIDKTGVITKSRIVLAEEHTKNPEMLTNISLLSCDTKPIPSSVPAFDQAIILSAAFKHIDIKELQQNELIRAFPFSEESKIGGNLWRINGVRILCVKGSPENIYNICAMQPDQLYSMQKKQHQYSKLGHQVIAVAYSRLPDNIKNPESIFDVEYTFAGLLAFTNQTRDSIPAAIRGCYRSGVNIIMLTGDSVDTATAISRKIGLSPGKVITGDQLKKSLDSGEKLDLTDVNIFARINPGQKLEIVKLLQERGEIVGITGESASDYEVLRQADVGIIRSGNASGSAQEACGLIMNDDNFGSIVETLREARQLHRNIKRVIGVSMSALLAQILFAVFNLAAGGEFILSPLLTSFIAAVLLPACMMFYADNRSDMKSTLSSSGFIGRGKLDKGFFLQAAYKGLALFAAMVLICLIMPGEAFAEARRSALLITVTTGILTMSWLGLSENTLIYKMITGKNNIPLMITGCLLILVLFIVYVPFLSPLFGLKTPELLLLILSFILGFISQLPFDLMKLKKND